MNKKHIKTFVTGATGQLEYDIIKELKKRNIDSVGVWRKLEYDW